MRDRDRQFRTTLDSACAEDYPWHEILIPVFGDGLPDELAAEITKKGARIFTVPEDVLTAAKGTYVEWLLPGETVRPDKLRHMAACLGVQDETYPLLLSDARDTYDEVSPRINIGVTMENNMLQFDCENLWAGFLERGKYPSQGLAGVLVRREVFIACHGLITFLSDAYPRLLSIWRLLLLTSRRQPCQMIGVTYETYGGPVRELEMEELVAHQLDWHALCIEDSSLLSDEEQQNILDSQRRIGIYLLEHAIASGIDLQSGIWPAYQQMLASL